jgi:hypothetical protein
MPPMAIPAVPIILFLRKSLLFVILEFEKLVNGFVVPLILQLINHTL